MRGSGFTLVDVKTHTTDVLKVATEFKDMDPAPVERKFKPARARYIDQKLVSGTTIPFIFVKARYKGKVVRMNGQHSSYDLCAHAEAGNSLEGITVIVYTYDVESEEGLTNLFRQFDARVSGRDTNDVAGAYQNMHHNLRIIPPKQAKLTAEAIAWYREAVLDVPAPKGDDRYKLMDDESLHEDFIAVGTVTESPSREMFKIGVYAAMYAIVSRAGDAGIEFCKEVAEGGGEDDFGNTTVTAAWLRAVYAKEGLSLQREHLYQGFVYMWNAHCNGDRPEKVKVDYRKGLLKPLAGVKATT